MKLLTLSLVILFAFITSCSNKNGNSPQEYKILDKEKSIAHNKAINPQYEEQLENIIDMLEKHPKSAKLYAERANLFVLVDKTLQALQDIIIAVDLDPENSEYRVNKGQLLRQFKRNVEALEEFNKALEIDSKSIGGYFNRGALFFNNNKFEKALKDFSTCIKLIPKAAPPYFNRAFTYEQLHDFSAAKNDLKKFVQITENKEWKKIAQDKINEWEKVEYKTVIEPNEMKELGYGEMSK